MSAVKNRIPSIIISIFVVFILFISIYSYINFSRAAYDINLKNVRNSTVEELHLIEDFLKDKDIRFNKTELTAYIKKISNFYKARIEITDLDGGIFAGSENASDSIDVYRYLPEIDKAIEHGYGEDIRSDGFLNSPEFHYAKKSGSIVIRISKPVEYLQDNSLILKIFIISGIVSLITLGVLIVYLKKNLTEKIKIVQIFSDDFTSGNTGRRLFNYSDDEIGTICRSVNKICDSMTAKVEEAEFRQKRLKITLENISEGIAVIGKDKRIVITNSAFAGIFDYNSDAAGKIYFEIIRNAKINSQIESVITSKSGIKFEEKIFNGKIYDIYISHVDDADSLQGVLIVLRDITEKKKIEQIKADLVGNMSHELKTPIAILKGYLETISENLSNTEMSSELISRAIENADRQNSIINDILKLHMIESEVEFDFEKIDLEKVILNCLNILSPKSSAKKLKIISDMHIPGKVPGNKFLIEEIFFNILNNSITYNNESGEIIIKAFMVNEKLHITIRDTGIGIPSDSIDRIFERFYRVDKSRSRETGGTGLGLSIVKHACDILKWDIKAFSDGQGTEFRITI
jgi:two-component system phosphate regulon sensor histidine kinase PhoR